MKKAASLILALVMVFSMMPHALAASEAATTAANKLNELGLFSGVGTNEDGTPNYDLDRAPTRQEAITMLVKLVGGAEEAGKGGWETPFTDVDNWAKNWVGYAYAKKLTAGTSATTFGANEKTTVAQYLTFVLKALGYDAASDFSWDKAWELSDQIGLTNGEYNADSNFTRGDVAIISHSALSAKLKGQEKTLAESLGLTLAEQEPEDTTTEQTPETPEGCYPGTSIQTFEKMTGVNYSKVYTDSNYTCYHYDIPEVPADGFHMGYKDATYYRIFAEGEFPKDVFDYYVSQLKATLPLESVFSCYKLPLDGDDFSVCLYDGDIYVAFSDTYLAMDLAKSQFKTENIKPIDSSECYPGTKIKTFTAVTGVECASSHSGEGYYTGGSYTAYYYKNGGEQLSRYCKYLDSIGERYTQYHMDYGAYQQARVGELYVTLLPWNGLSYQTTNDIRVVISEFSAM